MRLPRTTEIDLHAIKAMPSTSKSPYAVRKPESLPKPTPREMLLRLFTASAAFYAEHREVPMEPEVTRLLLAFKHAADDPEAEHRIYLVIAVDRIAFSPAAASADVKQLLYQAHIALEFPH